MDFDEKLSGAFIGSSAKHYILGVKLRPFCLWHRLLLETLDSPFLQRGEVTAHDLKTAVAVCRLRFGDTRLRPPWRPFLRLRPLVEQFIDYAGDNLGLPEYAVFQKSGGSPPPSREQPPEVIRIVGDIIGWTHWDEQKIWELPIGRAYWYQMMAARSMGADISYLGTEGRKFQAKLKASLEAEAKTESES